MYGGICRCCNVIVRIRQERTLLVGEVARTDTLHTLFLSACSGAVICDASTFFLASQTRHPPRSLACLRFGGIVETLEAVPSCPDSSSSPACTIYAYGWANRFYRFALTYRIAFFALQIPGPRLGGDIPAPQARLHVAKHNVSHPSTFHRRNPLEMLRVVFAVGSDSEDMRPPRPKR